MDTLQRTTDTRSGGVQLLAPIVRVHEHLPLRYVSYILSELPGYEGCTPAPDGAGTDLLFSTHLHARHASAWIRSFLGL